MKIKRYTEEYPEETWTEFMGDIVEDENGEWVKYEDIKHLLNVPKAEAVQPPESYPKLSEVRALYEAYKDLLEDAMNEYSNNEHLRRKTKEEYYKPEIELLEKWSEHFR